MQAVSFVGCSTGSMPEAMHLALASANVSVSSTGFWTGEGRGG